MFHLCRTFEDPDITHVEGDVSCANIELYFISTNVLIFYKVDPIRDLDIINEELRLKVHFDLIFIVAKLST